MDLKQFPLNYANDARTILETMSFGKGLQIMGSMNSRRILYAADYDGFESVKVPSVEKAVGGFKEIIHDLLKLANVYIADIKCGAIADWDILDGVSWKDNKVLGYDKGKSVGRLNDMKSRKLITPTEYTAAKRLLKPSLNQYDYLIAKDELKFHIVRWTPSDVLKGHTILRDGSEYTLSEGFTSPALTKVDVIGMVQNSRYTDFSVIYEFIRDGRVLNPTPNTENEITDSLSQSVLAYLRDGNYFKALKRVLSLSRLKGTRKQDKIVDVLNSDLGLVSMVISDIDTLLFILDRAKKLPEGTIHFEVDQFIERLSKVSLPAIVAKNVSLNNYIRKTATLPLGRMSKPLQHIRDVLDSVLQKAAKPVVEGLL